MKKEKEEDFSFFSFLKKKILCLPPKTLKSGIEYEIWPRFSIRRGEKRRRNLFKDKFLSKK